MVQNFQGSNLAQQQAKRLNVLNGLNELNGKPNFATDRKKTRSSIHFAVVVFHDFFHGLGSEARVCDCCGIGYFLVEKNSGIFRVER